MTNKYTKKGRENLMHTLRDELPVLRAKGKVTQEEIATRVGISRQTYSAIETGKSEMSWTVFLALLVVFNNDSKTRQVLESVDGFSIEVDEEIRL